MTATQDWTEEQFSWLYEKAEAVARTVRRSYPMVDTDDLIQEALLWAVQHPGTLQRYLEDDEGIPKVMGAMKNTCRDYAVRQRALARGDDHFIDDAFYSLDMLKGREATGVRGLLHHVFDDESWTNPPRPEGESTARVGDPAEGNNWLATLADVSSALDKLRQRDEDAADLIEASFHWGLTYDQIGLGLEPSVSKQTVSRRMDRAIKKVQEILGGPRPRREPEEDGWENGLVGTRRAISNAHARAITGSDYEE